MSSKEPIKQIVQKVTEDIQLDVFNEKLKDIVNDWSDLEIIRTETIFRIDDKKSWKKIAPVFWIEDEDKIQDYIIIAIRKWSNDKKLWLIEKIKSLFS